MTPQVASTCTICGASVDTALLGGTCPRCLLGDVMVGGEERGGGEFGGHELLGEIARGGMGVVYRARQLEPDRLVALKTLRGASLDSPEAKARFRHEAEVMVALDHAAILPVYHCGEQDGIPFFTMKLVEGGTLADRMGGYASQWRDIAALMATVGDAVRHAHERGVLHRDLKPGNILFDTAGQAYVSDFGIAKLADAQNTSLTMTISMIGTPHYLAPEVAAGGTKAASVSSDVWSLGVVLYELLTGEKPFRGGSVTEILRALDATDAPAPGRLRPDVPRDLEVITRKALSREPPRRYATVQAMAEDLRAWLEGRPIKARAVPATERAWMWARRNPLLAGTAALLMAAVVAAVAALMWGFARVKQENTRVIASETQTRAHLRDALLQQARQGRTAREMGWRAVGLTALREANAIQPGDDLRDEMIAHLAGYDLKVGQRVLAGLAFPSPALDSYIHLARGDRPVRRRMADDAELWTLPPFANARQLQVVHDPRGRWVAVGTRTEGRVFSLPDHREVARWPGAQLHGASADGERLFVEEAQCWRVVRCADWSDELRLDRLGAKRYPVAAFHPLPGRTLLASAFQHHIELIDWRTGAVLDTLRPVATPVGFSWCDDTLVAGCGNGVIQGFDLRRERSVILGPQFAAPNFFQATRDGKLLLTSGVDGIAQLWHLSSGSRLVRAAGMTFQQLGEDGRGFLTAGPVCKLGEIEHPPCVTLLPDRQMRGVSSSRTLPFDLSPDGRLLVVHDVRRVAVHEVRGGRLVGALERSGVLLAAFSPDGRELWLGHAGGLSVHEMRRQDARLVLPLVRELAPPIKGRQAAMQLSGDRARVLLGITGAGTFETTPDRAGWQRWDGPADATVGGFAPSPDDRWLAGVPASRSLLVAKGGVEKPRALGVGAMPGRAAFSRDGRWLVYTATSRRWFVHEAPEWRLVHTSPFPPNASWTNVVSTALDAAWSPDSRWFAVSGDGVVIDLVEQGTWRVMARLRGPLEIPISCMRAGADSASLVVQRSGGPVEIWDLRKLAEELRECGIELRLPPPSTPPSSPPELAGPFEEMELPPPKIGSGSGN